MHFVSRARWIICSIDHSVGNYTQFRERPLNSNFFFLSPRKNNAISPSSEVQSKKILLYLRLFFVHAGLVALTGKYQLIYKDESEMRGGMLWRQKRRARSFPITRCKSPNFNFTCIKGHHHHQQKKKTKKNSRSWRLWSDEVEMKKKKF